MEHPHYFAGGNTACGFYSCFEDILPAPKRKRMFYLKGGPGVGKSTLMKRAAAYAKGRGLQTELFHCSSDPDSLDGLCLPQRGLALMDGTAPHVYDPAVPAARDTLLSLGDFLDEDALRPHARDIAALQAEISARFHRCYRYLSAARECYQAPEAGRMEESRADALARAIADTFPLRGGRGAVRRLFAAAYTPKGRVEALHLGDAAQVTKVELPFGLYATGLMQRLSAMAVSRGLDVVELLDPLSPGEIAHLYLPGHDIAVMSGPRPKDEEGWVEADRLFALADDREQGFDRNAFELLIQRATEQLSAAKALHDQLEGYYSGHMDFLKWQKTLDRVLAAIDQSEA